LIDAGADLVVGHHPHVPQEVEEYSPSTNSISSLQASSGSSSRTSWIAYSLGNFVFDQNFSDDTKHGLMLRVMVSNKTIVSVTTPFVAFSPTYQPLFPDQESP